jgi:hypothetical protein
MSPAEQSDEVFKAAPRSAAEAAETLEGADSAEVLASAPLEEAPRVLAKAAPEAVTSSEIAKRDELNRIASSDDEGDDSSDDGTPTNGSSVLTHQDPQLAATQKVLSDLQNGSPSAPTQVQNYREMLDKVSGKVPVQSRMNTGDAISALLGKQNAELQEAKEQRGRQQLIALLNDAGNTIGSALTPMGKTKPDVDFTNKLLMQAEQPMKDLAAKKQLSQDALNEIKAQKELASHQLGSAQTQNAQDMIRALQPDVAKSLGDKLNNMSAADIDNYQKMMELKQKYDANKIARDQLNEIKQSRISAGNNKDYENAARHFDDSINPAKVSSRTPMGRSQIVVDQASRIDTLLKQYPNPADMPKTKIHELAMAMNTMLSNGSPSIAGTHMLIPQSAVGDLNSTESYITNKIRGANQASFVNDLAATISREKETSANIVRNYQLQSAEAASNAPWAIAKPERYNQIRKARGLLDQPSQSDQLKPHDQDAEAIAWAKSQPPGNPKAQAILKANGL